MRALGKGFPPKNDLASTGLCRTRIVVLVQALDLPHAWNLPWRTQLCSLDDRSLLDTFLGRREEY